MNNPKLRAVSATDDELADAVSESLAKDTPPSTRTLIARTKKSLAGSIGTLNDEKDRIEKRISDLRRDLHNVTETIGALVTAQGKLAESAAE